MKKQEIELRPSYWASVSGGKDSLYMLKLILENPDKYPLDGVAHFELEIDYPFIKNVIDYMESECKKHGIRFVRIKPEKSFYELYQKNGYPTRHQRWCNGSYKMNAKRQLEKFLNEQGAYLVSYIGYCYDEVKRYQKAFSNKKRSVTEIYPLVDYQIIEKDILAWARKVPLFNDYYIFNDRCGCMFCPLQTYKNTAYLLKYYPEEYKRMCQLASDTEKDVAKRSGFETFSVWQGQHKYDTEYRDKMVIEKYLPMIEKIAKENERR